MEFRGSGAEVSTGTTQKNAHILSWSEEVSFDTDIAGPPDIPPKKPTYTFAPYVWLQKAKSSGGVNQAFLVLDYWVPTYYESTASAALPAVAPASPALTPTVPLLTSPTHPDEATWYTANTATFTWAQPAGDPAVIAGYNWQLDGAADTAPGERIKGLANEVTYTGLGDGIWHMHVRAASAGGQWSDTAHRVIRVDANAPQVELAVDPAWPTGSNGWYVTPLTVTVVATDTPGSGVPCRRGQHRWRHLAALQRAAGVCGRHGRHDGVCPCHRRRGPHSQSLSRPPSRSIAPRRTPT